jgi:hypothetical protein
MSNFIIIYVIILTCLPSLQFLQVGGSPFDHIANATDAIALPVAPGLSPAEFNSAAGLLVLRERIEFSTSPLPRA